MFNFLGKKVTRKSQFTIIYLQGLFKHGAEVHISSFVENATLTVLHAFHKAYSNVAAHVKTTT